MGGTHYTATINVSKTTQQPGRDQARVVEDFRVTVRADTLEKIKKKVKAHMDLIDIDDLKGDDV